MVRFKTGLIPSPPDRRDYVLTAMVKPLKVAPPDECLQWLDWKTPVKFQSELGACVSFAVNGAMEIYNYKTHSAVYDLSEQFLYGETKKIDGIVGEGTYLRATFKVLTDTGVCEETYQPYEGKYPPMNSPTPEAYTNAQKFKIGSYAAVGTTKEELKTAIFQTGPVLCGIMAYESFENTGTDGVVSMPTGKLLGGHALMLPGYNSTGLIAKNSWSLYWGKEGYCNIPWAVWDAVNVGEAWSIVDIDTPNTVGIGAFFNIFCKKGKMATAAHV